MTEVLKAIRTGSPGSLVAAFLYFDVSFMVWVLIGALGVFISEDLGLTATEKGLLVGIPLLAGAFFRIVIGFLTDRFGPKRTGVLTLLFLVIPLVWGWLAAKGLTEASVLGLLLGVAGASFAVALPLASRWYPPEHQGLAMGIAGAGNSGSVLSVLFAPLLAEQVGWHGVFGLAIIPVGVTLGLFVLLAKEPPVRSDPPTLIGSLALLCQAEIWWCVLFYSLTFGGFVGLSSFLSIFLHDQYGVAAVQAGGLAALCVFSGSFFRPLGGYLADRMGGVRVLVSLSTFLPCLFLGLGFPFLGISEAPLWMAVILLFFVMMGLGMGNGAIFQMVPQLFRKEIGMVTGVIGAAGGLGGFFLPALLGYLKDASGSYGTGLLIFGGMILLLLRLPLQWTGSLLGRRWAPERAPASGGVSVPAEAVTGQVRMEVVFGG